MPAIMRKSATLALIAGVMLALPAAAAPNKVIIENTNVAPAMTQDVNNPAFQPIQFSLLPSSTTSGQNAVYYQVPAGKRLVIEYYSAQAQDLTGGAVGLTLGTTSGGNFASFIVFVNQNNTNAVNQTTRIYADPGSFVQAFVFNGGGATHCGSLITVSGYLVNVAAPPAAATPTP